MKKIRGRKNIKSSDNLSLFLSLLLLLLLLFSIVPLCSKLSDIFGRKAIILIGIANRVYFTYNRQNFTPTLKSFTDTQTTFFLFLPHNMCFYAYLEHLLPISFLKKKVVVKLKVVKIGR